VSNFGDVRDAKTKILLNKIMWNNYPSVKLKKDNKIITHRIHRLVAIAFIDNQENKKCVNHKDGVKANNIVSNLEWVTSSENNHHAMQNGLNQAPRGHDQNFSKLTNEMVIEICEKLNNKLLPREICNNYNVSERTIYDIKLGNTWSWLTGIRCKNGKRNKNNAIIS